MIKSFDLSSVNQNIGASFHSETGLMEEYFRSEFLQRVTSFKSLSISRFLSLGFPKLNSENNQKNLQNFLLF